ncbi:MAG: glycosyltransferase family 39 protein [Patescibacteria group bacterium]
MFDVFKVLKFVKNVFSAEQWIAFIGIITAFFTTRLINLTTFPIFTDEGIYINWAKIAWKDASWRFISLTDGRQPLQTWGTIPFLKFFPDNPLLAGRLFAVFSGLATLLGIVFLTYYLFGKRASLIAGILYVLTPFFIFYDRLALVDSMVNAGFVWILFGSIVLVKTMRLDVALVLGLISGTALLAKSSSRLFIGLAALAPILGFEKNKKKLLSLISNFYFLFLISSFIALVMYNIQRLSPYLNFVAEKNKTFVLTFSEFLQSPFQLLFHNTQIIPYYIASESGYVLILFGLIGLYFLFKKDVRLAGYLTLWIVLPFFAISSFAKVVYPRYLIFFVTTLLILAAYFLTRIKKKNILVLCSTLYVLSVAYLNYTMLFDQSKIPLPAIDRWQYIEGVSSGWGLKELMTRAKDESQGKRVILIAEGNFGVVGDMLNASLAPNDNVNVKGYWPLEKKHLVENQPLLKKDKVFIVFSHRKEFPTDWPMKKVEEYHKPGNDSAFYLFELLEQ